MKETPFSYLWKGINDFFTSVFKPCEEHSLGQRMRRLEEKNIALRARLDEKEVSLQEMKGCMERQLKVGARGIEDVLNAHVENLHMKQEHGLEGIDGFVKRHEVAIAEYLRYKQWHKAYKEDYETLAEKLNALSEHARFLEQQVHELAVVRNYFENFYVMERDKAAI